MTPVGEILLLLMDQVSADRALPETLCRSATATLPAEAASLTLMNGDGVSEIFAGSDDRSLELAQLQFTLGEGPGLTTFTSGRIVQEPDLAHGGMQRWPIWAAGALALGIRSVFSFPLRMGGIRLGVLEFYDDQTTPLGDARLSTALHYADAAVLIVLHLQGARDESGPTHLGIERGLEEGFWLNSEVHQATGMVSVQAVAPLSDALLLLRAHAYTEGRSISDVAHDVVTRLVRFD